MIRRKGQGAMEYLMTYGWAILVVMVVGIVMWQLGIFNLGGVTSTTSTGFPRIKPQLALISMNKTYLKATFTNGAGGPVNLNSATFASDASCNLDASVASYATDSISVGENFELTGVCSGATGSTGDPYDLDLTLNYNVSLAGTVVTHSDKGTLRGPIE